MFTCKIVLQLSELVNVEGYGDWIQLVAEFTIKSLQSWQVMWCRNFFFQNLMYNHLLILLVYYI